MRYILQLQNANLMIVMLLGGIWHGASWNYMFWGGAHGLFLALERMMGAGRSTLVDTLSEASLPRKIAGWARIFTVFTLVSFLWLTFRLTDIGQVWLYVKQMTQGTVSLAPQPTFTVLFFSLPVLLYHLAAVWRGALRERWSQWPEPLRLAAKTALYGALFFMILINSGTSGAFIYFQF